MRCCVIGEGSLPIRCAEALLDRGHELTGLVGGADPAREWAAARPVPWYPATDLAAALTDVDYLFSVVNPVVLPAAAIRAPTRGAVNYHDGPLPRYAGLRATTWALLAGETEHAITWHTMLPEVDAGPILAQRPVPVGPDDTAFTLNAKCYTAALDAFGPLVDDLAADRARPRPQDPTGRTYFGATYRPDGGGVLRWDEPADRAYALVRAMSFGPAPNPILLPRLVLPDGRIRYVVDLRPAGPAGGPPGTVRWLGGTPRVATATEDVELRAVVDHAGQPVDLTGAVTDTLPVLPPDRVADLTDATRRNARYEPYWTRRLAALRPATPPTAHRPPHRREPGPVRTVPVPVPTRGGGADLVLAAFAGYLARTNGGARDVGYRRPDRAGEPDPFARYVPLRLDIDLTDDTPAARARVSEAVADRVAHGTYPLDLVARHPRLAANPTLRAENPLPVCVAMTRGGPPPWPGDGAVLSLVFDEDSGACHLSHDTAAVPDADADLIADHLATLLERMAAEPDRPVGQVSTRGPVPAADPVPARVGWFDLVAAHGSAPAVRERSGETTYRELDERARRLADAFADDGPVVVPARAGADQVATVLGALYAGRACPPPADTDPPVPPVPGDIAFVTRTARREAAVELTHTRALVTATGVAQRLGLGPGDRVPLWSEPGGYLWLVELLATLAGGATVLTGSDRDATFPLGSPDRLIRWAATADPDRPEPRGMCVSGEAGAIRSALDAVGRVYWDLPAWVGYGLAEAPMLTLGAADAGAGRPLPGISVRVVDATGEPAPTGVVGQVRFRYPGERAWTDTGDLGRTRPDGTLECVGAVDRRVFRYGYSYQAEDVEALARRLPGARDAVLAGTTLHLAGPVGSDPLTVIRALLPPVMVPDAVRVVDAVPRTRTGAVDVPALENGG